MVVKCLVVLFDRKFLWQNLTNSNVEKNYLF